MAKTVAIIPADGWWFVLNDEHGEYGERVLCWLVDEDGEVTGRSVPGMGGDQFDPAELKEFAGYRKEGPMPNQIRAVSHVYLNPGGTIKEVC